MKPISLCIYPHTGVLPLKYVCSTKRIRWALAAHDICFTNKMHSTFFMYGKCIPCVRGGGVFQAAVDVCIHKLENGEWVHVFPEGKVNMAQEYIRFKWGVGRMIYESPVVPIVIPIWHKVGDDVVDCMSSAVFLHVLYLRRAWTPSYLTSLRTTCDWERT